MPEIAAIILAAGSARRFRESGGEGPSKLVADLGGEALVRRVVRAALASAARPVVVVTGHAAAAVAATLAGLPANVVENPDYAQGMASSLRRGLAAVPASAQGAIVLLGDMPGVDGASIDALIDAFAARPGALAVIPVFAGRRGNPALLSRALFPALAKLNGDEGARHILAAAPAGAVFELEVGAADAPIDVDTRQALEDARAKFAAPAPVKPSRRR